jgi:hypothetical protein
MIPLEIIYGILDDAKAMFTAAAAAENMAMDYIQDNCKCGQDHDPEDIPKEVMVLAQNSMDASANTVDLVRGGIEDVVKHLLDQGSITVARRDE